MMQMPRPSQKDNILDAALECFAQRGYAATRLRDIVERAGVSEAALYRHYPSKEAVAQTLFAYHLRDFSAQLTRIAHERQPLLEQLRDVMHLCLATYRAKPAAFSFVLLNTPSFMPQLPPDTVYPLDVIEQIMAAGQQQGVVRPGQPNLLAAIFMGCVLRPIIMSQLADPGALDLLHDTHHDQVIIDAALAAVTLPI
jgi:AcrR family transcriptional regulator